MSVWTVLTAATSVLAVSLLPGTLELLALTMAGIFKPKRLHSGLNSSVAHSETTAYPLTVVVPAHNEALLISRCVGSLLAADMEGVLLRVVVIADNCTDGTAACAREAGAEVLERFDARRRGKGPALQFAFEALQGPRAVAFAVVDADTEVDANFFTETAAALRAGASATQARYLVRAAVETPRSQLVRLASAAYNILRARGRAVLGFSAGIYGNGFALAEETLRLAPYTADSIVEDIEYHLKLLACHRRVVFLDRTAVHAELPVSSGGAESQRLRWDGGRMRIAALNLPGIAGRVLQGEVHFIEPLFDLLLPPLVFYGALMSLVCLSPAVWVRSLGVAGLTVLVLHLSLAAFVGGRGVSDLRGFVAIPKFVLWKIILLPKLLRKTRRNAEWVRTERTTGAVK